MVRLRAHGRGSEAWAVAGSRRSAWRRMTGPQLFVASFFLLVVVGAVGFRVLPGLYTGESLSWSDAFFTAASAVCVTGLIVVDTATFFTPAGQAWILLLIQLGGLGFITFTTLIIVALGRRLSLRHEALVSAPAALATQVDYRRLTRDIVRFTVAVEGVGAAILYLLWVPELGLRGAAWPAVFHSVSAFCNAGFSTFSDSLVGFQEAPALLAVLGCLVVVGGIGFLVMEELRMVARRGDGRRRLSLHARLVLATTAVLLLGGWVVLTLFEGPYTLSGMAFGDRLANGFFMSATARTAGFNSVDYAALSAESSFFTILLMMIGGSPGSTAGGLKTTTVALIGLLAWSRLRGRREVSVWGRSVPEETVQRATGLFVVAFGLVTAAIMALVALEAEGPSAGPERAVFLPYMFEVVSAFNTVGLSMNLTPELSIPGRWLLAVLMFVGRVGPLTFAAAIALERRPGDSDFRFAHEDVVVG